MIKSITEETAEKEEYNPDSYYCSLGKIGLLTKEQEVQLAKRIERGTSYKKGVRVRTEDAQEAVDIFARHNLKWVVTIAKKYMHTLVPLDDLVSAGNEGLIRAINSYDWRRGYRFTTYSFRAINQAIHRSLPSERIIRVPADKNRLASKMMQLADGNDFDETCDKHFRGKEEELNGLKCARKARNTFSLNYEIGDCGIEAGDYMEDTKTPLPQNSNELKREEDRELLDYLLMGVSKRDREILSLRENFTLRDIGKIYGMTAEAIGQIEERTIAKARKMARDKGLMGVLSEK